MAERLALRTSGHLWLAIGSTLIYAAMAIGVLANHEWDPKAFVLERPADVPDTQTWGIGYDGQQAFAIALNPLDAAAALDRPAYRYMRIVYPLAARALAFGTADLIPWSMLVLNLVVVGVTAWLLADLIGMRAGPIWAALILLFSFNYWIGVRLDLNEPLAFCLAIGGLWLYQRDKLLLSVAAFALAGLTKEVTLAFPIALSVYEITRRNFRIAVILLGGSLIPYLIWSATVTSWQGASPFSYSLAKPTLVPFAGLGNVQGFETLLLIVLWAVGPAIIAMIVALWHTARARPDWPSLTVWLLLANVLVIAMLPADSWVDPLAVLRLGIGVLVAVVLWTAETQPRLIGIPAAIWIPSLLIVVLIPGFLI